MRPPTDVTLLDDVDKDRSWRACRMAGTLDIIEKFNLAYVVSALDQTGLARGMRRHLGGFDAESFPPVSSEILRMLLRYLRVHSIVSVRDDGSYDLTPLGHDLLSDVSLAQLGFYVKAYGSVMTEIPRLLAGDATYGVDVQRNGGALAEHCATLFAEYHTDTVLEAIGDLRITKLLDLGCGGGQFLIDAARLRTEFTGIGLDISAAAIESARREAARAGVNDRIKFLVADAFDPTTWSESCHQVDAILAVGVIHECFRDGEVAVVKLLNMFASLLEGGVRAFILGEPEIRYDRENSDSDLLLVHTFTAQGFPRPREDWLRVIDQSRLECRRIYTRANAGPRFNFFDLTVEQLSA